MADKNATQTLKLQAVYSACFALIGSLPSRVLSNHMILELFNTVVVRFLILIVNFTATTLITRALSVEDRGHYAILLSLINVFVTIFTFGFHTSIIYRLSNNLKLFTSLYSIAFFISMFATLLSAVSLLCGNLIHIFPELDHWDTIILICGGPIALFSYFNVSFFLGIQKPQHFNLFEFIKSFSLVFLSTVMIFLPIHSNYKIYALFYIASSFFHAILSFVFFFKKKFISFNEIKINFRNYYFTFKESIDYSMVSYCSCILAIFLSKYNLFFVGWAVYFDDAEKNILGHYAVALTNLDIICLVPTTLAFFIFPKISAVAEMETKIRITINMMLACFLFFIIIAIFSFTALEYLFLIIYGAAYQASVPMFQLLLPSALFLSMLGCISSFIGGIGTQRVMIYAPLAGLIFITLTSFILVYMDMGIYYYIFSQNISYFVYFIIYIVYFIREWRKVNA